MKLAMFLAFTTLISFAQIKENVLHDFCQQQHCVDGAGPNGNLIFDNAGNLYGVAGGGTTNRGVVFELSPVSGGGWSYAILYSFQDGNDGNEPRGSLVFDGSGNLYGTTETGGLFGQGTVFELSPVNGQWAEAVLYSFGSNPGDGFNPISGVSIDSAGNLFGTTNTAGITSGSCPSVGCGTVFEVSPGGVGSWVETTLYSFQGGADGEDPWGTVILDRIGNLYGTTAAGGSGECPNNPYRGCGTVFELSPVGDGSWTETILHEFQGRDGAAPLGTLVFDANGNIFGTAEAAGASGGGRCDNFGRGGCGAVFELSPSQNGWSETVIHSFLGLENGHDDGSNPFCGVVSDSIGRIYGTTYGGGNAGSWGTVFRLTPSSNGKWSEQRYDFSQPSSVYSGVILDASDNVFGVTVNGGTTGAGSAFELISPK
jgi:uncharacterized repeat protein (TIGR03803 family)